MSKIFYDHLVVLEEVDVEIKNISKTIEEKEELWKLVDEIVNHRLMITILDKLPIENHSEFLSNFYDAPHDPAHFDYLNQKIEDKIEEVIVREVENLKKELLHEIKSLKK
jgi:hypothetical protein